MLILGGVVTVESHAERGELQHPSAQRTCDVIQCRLIAGLSVTVEAITYHVPDQP